MTETLERLRSARQAVSQALCPSGRKTSSAQLFDPACPCRDEHGHRRARRLRNQMVHEYVEDPAVLWDALQAGRRYVPALANTAQALVAEVTRRGWDRPASG